MFSIHNITIKQMYVTSKVLDTNRHSRVAYQTDINSNTKNQLKALI